MGSTAVHSRHRDAMRIIGRSFAAAAITVAGVLTGAAPASGAITCEYNQAADTLTVTADVNGDRAILFVAPGGEIGVLNAGAGGNVACSGAGGPPTVNNTSDVSLLDTNVSTSWAIANPEDLGAVDTAAVLPGGNDNFTIFDTDLSNDFWVLGKMGINWNGDMDVDAALVGVEQVVLFGNDGNDAMTARGQDGTGAPFAGPGMFVGLGGGGNDVVEGGDTGDLLLAGPGIDTLRGFGGPDVLGSDAGTNQLQGGGGDDRASYLNSAIGVRVDLNVAGAQDTGIGTDTLTGIEGLEGTNDADELFGNADANTLMGQDGDDTLDGGGGKDPLDGGAGVDTATYESAPAGVSVDLDAGTATGGAGNDTLSGIDNLVGSSFADTLFGDAANNSITGLGGTDRVRAKGGADAVNVRDSGPDTASCGTEVDTAIADRASVDSVNPDCETVDFIPEPGGDGGPEPGGNGGGGGSDAELEFELRGKRTQRVAKQKGVIVKASCPLEDCKVEARGKGRLPGAKESARAKLRLKPVTEEISAGITEKIKLRLKGGKLRALKKVLAAGKRPKLKVTAEATDAAGNTATAKRNVRAKR
jgi:Ca2+-binding RTX toxin-like protein